MLAQANRCVNTGKGALLRAEEEKEQMARKEND